MWSRIVGASALITGSTVGAGMLALPAATAPLGPLPSTLVLFTVWGVLLAEAMLIAEVNIAVTQQPTTPTSSAPRVTTMRQMAEATLGPTVSNAVTATYLLLAYGLLVAYIGKAGDALHHLTLELLPSDAGMTLAVTSVVLLLAIGGPNAADTVNRTLTAVLLALFAAILVFAGPLLTPGALLNLPTDWSAAPCALPIIFLTLVYHDLIPVLCMLLGHDRRAVRTSLVAGSILPLGMFASWNTLVLGLGSAGGDPLDAMVAAAGGGVGMAVQAFTLLAVLTSFIGITLGITETAKTELLDVPLLENSGNHVSSTMAVYAASLAPAVAVASMHPASFVDILQACGAYGMVLLYGILPPLMVLNLASPYRPPQLAPLLAVLVSFSVLVGGTHVVQDAKRLPNRLSLNQLEALMAPSQGEGVPNMVLVRGTTERRPGGVA